MELNCGLVLSLLGLRLVLLPCRTMLDTLLVLHVLVGVGYLGLLLGVLHVLLGVGDLGLLLGVLHVLLGVGDLGLLLGVLHVLLGVGDLGLLLVLHAPLAVGDLGLLLGVLHVPLAVGDLALLLVLHVLLALGDLGLGVLQLSSVLCAHLALLQLVLVWRIVLAADLGLLEGGIIVAGHGVLVGVEHGSLRHQRNIVGLRVLCHHLAVAQLNVLVAIAWHVGHQGQSHGWERAASLADGLDVVGVSLVLKYSLVLKRQIVRGFNLLRAHERGLFDGPGFFWRHRWIKPNIGRTPNERPLMMQVRSAKSWLLQTCASQHLLVHHESFGTIHRIQVHR